MSKAIRTKNGFMLIPETGAGYQIIRQGVFDYGNYLESMTDADRAALVPQFLEIHIALPNVPSPKDIDISVLPFEVQIKAAMHNFNISLPFEVLSEEDYSAKWKSPIITLRLRVKPPPLPKVPLEDNFMGIKLIEETNVSPLIEETEETEEVIAEGEMKGISETGEPMEVKPAKFAMTVDEKILTVILYVSHAVESTLKVENNVISVKNKKGQEYSVEINPPFPLKTAPHIISNPVNMKLIFTEELEEKKKDTNQEDEKREEQKIPDPGYELTNTFIFELEDM